MKKIIGFLITGNVSDEVYASAREDMYVNNVMMLRVLSAIASSIFAVCMILGLIVSNMQSKLSIYIVGVLFSLGLLSAALFSKNKKLHTFCMMMLDVLLLGAGLLITLVSAPKQLTVTLIPVALLVPLFFDVKPCVFLAVVSCADLIYLIFAPGVKPHEILVMDMVDVLAFSIAGITIGTILTKVKVERYAYANKIRKIALQDGLTECYNRKAYSDAESSMTTEYPSDFVFLSFDVNGLKVVNDTLGHEAGDEIILGASRCMLRSFGDYGKVYRTGGDEFTAILYMGRAKIENCIAEFEKEVSDWHGEMVDTLSVSLGYVKAVEVQGLTITEVAALADKRMYDAKAAFYSKKGIDRRGQIDAHKALCASYTKILKINLTDDTYQIVNMDPTEQTTEKGFVETISKWLLSFGMSGQVHPEDVEEYLRETDPTFLSNYFKDNNTSLCIFYRRKYGDLYKRVMMELLPAPDYRAENQSLFLYVKNIEK